MMSGVIFDRDKVLNTQEAVAYKRVVIEQPDGLWLLEAEGEDWHPVDIAKLACAESQGWPIYAVIEE